MQDLVPSEKIKLLTLCSHCGDPCENDLVKSAGKTFCCEGCKTVYYILHENGLADYYHIQKTPGVKIKKENVPGKFAYLDVPEVVQKLIDFHDDQVTKVTFFIPQMHCAACIWLLENLYKFNSNVLGSKVNFLKKEAYITFSNSITLREIIELLASLGYEPEINLNSLEKKQEKKTNRELYYKLGVAGFCFGNIMLLSFPEYLSLNKTMDASFIRFFSYFNLVLALPVFFYSSADYFRSAWNGLKAKSLDINVPIALGIFVLFTRSAYEILAQTGPGYMDSMTGLVFFMLIGRWFQNKTYDRLSFERDYKSYFPVAVNKRAGNDDEVNIPANNIKVGDVLVIRNGELVPTDAILVKGEARIDYSFVTGESKQVKVTAGQNIYAGGRQMGGIIEVQAVKTTSQSYLTQLWNQEVFSKNHGEQLSSLVNRVSRYFTPTAIAIALISGAYWLYADSSVALHAFSSVLIIVCPCALALSTPFTMGNVMRILGRNRFYVKDISVIERLTHTDEIVFDKTGTLTYSENQKINFIGALSPTEENLVKSLALNSSHPLSRQVAEFFEVDDGSVEIKSYKETRGKGIEGFYQNIPIKLGAADFVAGKKISGQNATTQVWVSINNEVKGYFEIAHHYREGLDSLIEDLKKDYPISILSGDSEGEKEFLTKYFDEANMHFRQTPEEKLSYLRKLEQRGRKAVMIGDGLNDAGALKQSHVGISVSENTGNFSPSCDVIMDATVFSRLPDFIRFSKSGKKILLAAFALSFLYNMVGLFFAVQGILTPVIAAILMPLSSITVTTFCMAATLLAARKNNLNLNDKSHHAQ